MSLSETLKDRDDDSDDICDDEQDDTFYEEYSGHCTTLRSSWRCIHRCSFVPSMIASLWQNSNRDESAQFRTRGPSGVTVFKILLGDDPNPRPSRAPQDVWQKLFSSVLWSMLQKHSEFTLGPPWVCSLMGRNDAFWKSRQKPPDAHQPPDQPKMRAMDLLDDSIDVDCGPRSTALEGCPINGSASRCDRNGPRIRLTFSVLLGILDSPTTPCPT